ncbi:SET domain-containing protein [Marasmius fiardii PR-910]|nr:SET domain-containing protein [Marasmius fiardii PR-910]
MSTSKVTPTDTELKEALKSLKSSNPTLGISKIHGLLLQTRHDWLVSEKRTRKFLQNEGLVLSADPNGNSFQDKGKAPYPSSRIIPNLDVGKWSTKVEVKYFNKRKGKGLVAKEKLVEGETVWKEDPFIIAPEWEIYDLQVQSSACSQCTTPFSSTVSTSLVTSCPSTSSFASSSSGDCPARFCNRLCQARSAKHHALLCPTQNPASIPLMKWTREIQWLALHALAQLTSRLMLANQVDPKLAEEDWRIYSSLAQLSLADRVKYSLNDRCVHCLGILGLISTFFVLLASDADPHAINQPGWEKAFELYIQAFRHPTSNGDQKKLAKLYKKPLKPEIERELFEYEGFLRGLGRMSLNLEAHGGLYTLHSHLNHACSPNISVRHFDRASLYRISVIALRDIEIGEELNITYVNPQSSVRARQTELEQWGFGKCMCERCVREAKELREKGEDVENVNGNAIEMKDLEKELKAGLGIM